MKTSLMYESLPREIHDEYKIEMNSIKSTKNKLEWYGWDNLHYAAREACPCKLGKICRNIGSKINILTKLSENALHILLEHGKFQKSYKISCQNGREVKLFKIIGREKECVVSCAEILINSGIDVNHNNFWNETPIMIAIKYKYSEIVKLLLKAKGIDLDSCRGAISGKTARELLNGKEAILGLLPTHTSISQPEKILFQLLKSGDEESFLKYNGGNIEQFANAIDGDSEENSSCNLLQFCFRRGLIAWKQEQEKYSYDSQLYCHNITAHPLVHSFCQNGLAKSIQHLLDNGANPELILIPKFKEPLLDAAALMGYYPLVCVLLGHKKSNFGTHEICRVIEKLPKGNLDLTTFSMLLNYLLSMKNLREHSEKIINTVLNVGIQILHADNIELLLKFPGSLSITAKKGKKKSILENVDPEILQAHLDHCVEQKNSEIFINYESFTENNSTKHVTEAFLKSSVLNLHLNHLVFKIWLNRQWRKFENFYFLNLAFYIGFYIHLHIYIVLAFSKKWADFSELLRISGIFFLFIFSMKEILQLIANFRHYFREFNNYIEIIFILLLGFTFFHSSVEVFMVLSVLTANLVFILQLEQIPRFGKYMIIWRTALYYLEFIFFYSFQFLGFAICFFILFSDPHSSLNIFYGILNKIFETIILFTGNLDYMDTKKLETNEFLGKFVFTLFALFIAIILHNLLLGLLVTDMNNFKENVKLFEQKRRASLIVHFENMFENIYIQNILKFFNYRLPSDILDDNCKYLIVNDKDRKMLDENEKQHLDFILTKKVQKPNVLNKLYNYIRRKIKEQYNEVENRELKREVLERLYLIEERIKNLQELR